MNNRRVFYRPIVAFVALALAGCSGGGAGPRGAGTAGTGATGTAGTGASAGSGATGTAGATGSAGSGGAAGPAGAAGDTGGAGTAGIGNPSGAAGVTGTAGASGTTGVGGTSGSGVDGSADTGAGANVHVFPSTQTVKLMVVGSSNEIGTCWRAYLWQDLRMAGIMNTHFVGQQMGGPSCTVTGWNDTALQAMSGIIITNIPLSTYLGWFKANPPDVILQHFGGADILAGMPVDGVMKAYATALMAARMVNPNVVLLIAQHTPEGKPDIVTLNAAIAAWAPTVSTPESPVIAVDLYTGMLPSDFSDGVHLNQTGAMKVADRWLAALKPFFGH
jgi:lysophospholipase L1-like esterase